MQVRFDEIPAEGREFEIKDSSWFPAAEVAPLGPVQARVLLERRGERVFLQGTLKARVGLSCDRCLEPYEYQLDHEFQLDLELLDQTADAAMAGTEHACHDSEMDVMFLAEPLVDLGEILAQQVFLTLPDKRLCSEDCQGLCPRCGANRNRGSCTCGDAGGFSPFAVLQTLKH